MLFYIFYCSVFRTQLATGDCAVPRSPATCHVITPTLIGCRSINIITASSSTLPPWRTASSMHSRCPPYRVDLISFSPEHYQRFPMRSAVIQLTRTAFGRKRSCVWYWSCNIELSADIYSHHQLSSLIQTIAQSMCKCGYLAFYLSLAVVMHGPALFNFYV